MPTETWSTILFFKNGKLVKSKLIFTFMKKNQGYQKNSENSSVLHLKYGNRDETNNK